MTFPKHDRSGVDSEALLRAAFGETKASHHFIKNQQRAVRLCDLTQKFQVARLRQIQTRIARDGFDDDSGDLILIRRERGLHRFDIVERQNNCVLRERGGHAGAVGMAEGERARTGFHEQRIRVAMITAIELDDFVALGESTREADGGHAGFRAGIRHAHFLARSARASK